MRVSSSRFGRLAAGAAALIGLAAGQAVLASPADALPGLQRPAKTSVSDSSTSKSVAARCPAGQNVIGGGGRVVGGRGQVVLERLQPVQTTAADGRFVVAAREDETGYAGAWSLTAHALCSDPLPGFGILDSTSGPASSNSPQGTISFCVGQTQVGFGGRVNSGVGQVHLTDLTRGTNGQVDFTSIAAVEDANGFAGAWNVTAYAVCATTPPSANHGRGAAGPLRGAHIHAGSDSRGAARCDPGRVERRPRRGRLRHWQHRDARAVRGPVPTGCIPPAPIRPRPSVTS